MDADERGYEPGGDEVRAMFRERSGDAPEPLGLLAKAHRRSRRRRSRRTAVVAAAVVIAVAGAGAVMAQSRQAGVDGGPGWTAPSESAAPGDAEVWRGSQFPYTPGWVPDGVADDAYFVLPVVPGQVRFGYMLSLDDDHSEAATLYLDAYATRPPDVPSGEEVPVRGVTGTRATGVGERGEDVLAWQDAPHVFLVLRTRNIAWADVARFAESLQRWPQLNTMPCHQDGPEPDAPFGEMTVGKEGYLGPGPEDGHWIWWGTREAGPLSADRLDRGRLVDMLGRKAVVGYDRTTGDQVVLAEAPDHDLYALHRKGPGYVMEDELVLKMAVRVAGSLPCARPDPAGGASGDPSGGPGGVSPGSSGG